jgi:hypothetical protein
MCNQMSNMKRMYEAMLEEEKAELETDTEESENE